MKTAISIPDQVFKSAEELANRLGKSRSQLYTQAISGYLKKYHNDSVTEKLNSVYGQDESQLDPVLKNLQLQSLSKDEW